MSAILAANTLGGLRAALPGSLTEPLTTDELRHIFGICEAIWLYARPASPERPHALLRNGNHSDFFVNCMDALKESVVLTALANQIVGRCGELQLPVMSPGDWVIGAERAGAPISQEVARQLGCRHATVEKDRDGNPTVFDRFDIAAGEQVLLVNDLLSHDDGSTYMSKVAVEIKCPGAVILPVAVHLVNRSGCAQLKDGTPVEALLEFVPQEYSPDNCELCQGGSPVMKLKPNKPLFFGQPQQ